MDNGTDDIKCSCSSSSYRYEPCGHIVTGDLSIQWRVTYPYALGPKVVQISEMFG